MEAHSVKIIFPKKEQPRHKPRGIGDCTFPELHRNTCFLHHLQMMKAGQAAGYSPSRGSWINCQWPFFFDRIQLFAVGKVKSRLDRQQ
jgi:hypothetical protein